MKKYIDWILTHKIKTVLIIFGIFLFPLIVIHFLYKWQTPHFLLQSSWSSGELITYIAGFEAFIGTVFLGAVAVWQNDRAKELSERVFNLEEKTSLFSRFPNIVIIGDHVDKGLFREHMNKELLAYINDDNFDIINEFKIHKDRSYFLVRFIVRNLSEFNVRIKLYKLYFEDIENDELSFIYLSNPINFKPKKAVIAPKNELIIGFLVEDKPQIRDVRFKGVMHLFISNNINEEFINTTEFTGFFDNESPGLFVLDQYDGELSEGSSNLI